jgi:hypothetical protein
LKVLISFVVEKFHNHNTKWHKSLYILIHVCQEGQQQNFT